MNSGLPALILQNTIGNLISWFGPEWKYMSYMRTPIKYCEVERNEENTGMNKKRDLKKSLGSALMQCLERSLSLTCKSPVIHLPWFIIYVYPLPPTFYSLIIFDWEGAFLPWNIDKAVESFSRAPLLPKTKLQIKWCCLRSFRFTTNRRPPFALANVLLLVNAQICHL